MTISDRYVGQHNVGMAQSLLGLPSFGDAAPTGCFAYLVLVVQQVARGSLRIFNYLCGGHQWHDNQTSRQIIQQYLASSGPVNDSLSQRMLQLYDDQGMRANGNVSYVNDIPRSLLSYGQRISASPLVRDSDGDGLINDAGEASPMLLYQLPPEICMEVFEKLDPESLLKALSVNIETRQFIKCQDRLFTDFLLELTMKKMFSLINGIETPFCKDQALAEIVMIQASIDPEQALTVADLIQTSHLKEQAILEIAAAYASINPSRAMEVFDLAGTNDQEKKDVWLAKIAIEQAVDHPAQALRTANLIQGCGWKSSALLEIGKKEASRSPVYAGTIFQSAVEAVNLAESTFRTQRLGEIAEGWALIDPGRARKLCKQALVHCSSMPTRSVEKVIAIISRAQALVSPQQARANVGRVLSKHGKGKLLYEISKVQANRNLEEAIITADLIQEPVWQCKALCAIAKRIGTSDLDQTNQLLDKAASVASQVRNGDFREIVLCRIAVIRAVADPEKPLAITALSHDASLDDSCQQDTNLKRAEYCCAIAEVLASRDLERAFETAHLIHYPDIRDKALCKIAKVQAMNNIEGALETAKLIEDRMVYVDALCEVAKACTRTDKMQANEIFFYALGTASGLEPTRMEYLQKEHFQMFGKVVQGIVGTR